VDVPMGRVKFNVNTEYAYIQNFKILQSESSLLRCPFTYSFAPALQTSLYVLSDILQISADSNCLKTLLLGMALIALSRSSPWSSAACKITLNFCNGPRGTGTNTSPDTTMMLWQGERHLARPLQLHPPLRHPLEPAAARGLGNQPITLDQG
jgi:hypothetical protein